MAQARKKKGGLGPFLALIAMYGAVFAARSWWRDWVRTVHLGAGSYVYYHDAIVDLRLWTRDPKLSEALKAVPPVVEVRRGGQVLTTIAGIKDVELAYDEKDGAWRGRWPCPWNAEDGEYTLALKGGDDMGGRLRMKNFRIARRHPVPLPRGFAVLTLESVAPLATMTVTAPDGTKKDWKGLLDWVEYAGADAFWLLGGQSPGQAPEQIWVDNNLDMIPEVARECHRRGLKFGVYAECYLTMSKTERLPRYQYALELENGRAVPTRAISLNDPNRPSDVAALLKRWTKDPDVDFVGLDYVRNALGGYELIDDFYNEMPGVHPPPEWPKLSPDERVRWFARKKIMRRDEDFIDAWQWWRAHRIAGIVRRIRSEIGGKKPLWAFTLTWDKGWHHGQDPVMMNDAGVDADALMLYQADKGQFAAIMKAWHDYVKRGDVQLVVGDIFDWGLHQKDPRGPREFARRLRAAIDGIYRDGPAQGIFFHDLGRALWGRLGPWGTRGWMDEAKATARYFRGVSGAP